MVEGQPAGHSVRCCWIGSIRLGDRLNAAQISELYYTLLLKTRLQQQCGAYPPALYDRRSTFKRDFMRSTAACRRSCVRPVPTGMKAGLAERFRALVHIFQNGGQIAQELMETRCDRGAAIARGIHSEGVAQAIHSLDEHWDGGGMPRGSPATTSRSIPASRSWRRSSTFSRPRMGSKPPSAKSRTGPEPGSIRDCPPPSHR